jgi:hypothetical protein
VVEGTPLLRLNIREQSIRFGEFACFDGFLRISFQGSDFGIVTGLSRCRFSKRFEVLGYFDELGSQPLRANVVLANNTQRGSHLAFIEVQFFLE